MSARSLEERGGFLWHSATAWWALASCAEQATGPGLAEGLEEREVLTAARRRVVAGPDLCEAKGNVGDSALAERRRMFDLDATVYVLRRQPSNDGERLFMEVGTSTRAGVAQAAGLARQSLVACCYSAAANEYNDAVAPSQRSRVKEVGEEGRKRETHSHATP